MKHILISLYDLHMGGIQTTALSYMNLFLSQGWQVDLYVVNPDNSVLLNQVPPEVTILTPAKNLANRWQKCRSIAESLAGIKWHHRLIHAEAKQNTTQYDLAIAFEGYHSHSDLYAAFVSAKSKAIWVHNDYMHKKRASKKEAVLLTSMRNKYQYFDHVVCVSKSAKHAFATLFPQYASTCQVITNPFDAEAIWTKAQDPTVPSHIVRDNNTFHMVAMGNLIPRKGFDQLITAFAQVMAQQAQQDFPTAGLTPHLTMIGEGSERQHLESLIAQHNLQNHITLTGQLTNPFPTLSQADLFVMSSHYEGLGMVILESLALGIPVVSSNISGASDAMHIFVGNNQAYGKVVENSEAGLAKGMQLGLHGKFTRGFQLDFDSYNKGIIQQVKNML